MVNLNSWLNPKILIVVVVFVLWSLLLTVLAQSILAGIIQKYLVPLLIAVAVITYLVIIGIRYFAVGRG